MEKLLDKYNELAGRYQTFILIALNLIIRNSQLYFQNFNSTNLLLIDTNFHENQ